MKNRINLLPALYRRQQLLRRRMLQWGAAVCAVLVVGWVSHWLEVKEQQALAQRLNVLTREHQPTRTKLQQLIAMRQKLEDLKQQQAVAQELEYHRDALVLLGVVSDSASKTDGRLRVTKLELSNLQSSALIEKGGDTESKSPSMLVGGVSLDYSAVSKFMKGLQESGCFSHVELLTSKEHDGPTGAICDYEIRCVF